MVVCPKCGHTSSGRFFCDRCLSLLPAPVAVELPAQIVRSDGSIVDCTGFGGFFPNEGTCPVETTCNGAPVRLYAFSPSWWRDCSSGIQRRAQTILDVLSPVEIVSCGDGAVVVILNLVNATRPLIAPLAEDADDTARLDDALAACNLLSRALMPLHEAGLVWLNFDPAGLLVSDGRVEIQSLDLGLFRAGECPDSIQISSNYSPPEVCGFRADRIGPATDVFHVAAHLYYRLARLLPNGFPGNGLEAFDFQFPDLRIYYPTLPAGIAPVLSRGLARESADRFACVGDLVAAFTEAIQRARWRSSSTRAIHLDVGCATAVGKTHEIKGLSNQDMHALLMPAPDLHLAIVADGVTHARIGTGEQASRTAVNVLSASLSASLNGTLSADDLDGAVRRACVEASEAILQAALAQVPADATLDPIDIMSSTVVLGIIRGNELTVASCGDSRAYLLHDGMIEQLTVDGDVRCVHLAHGLPPEQVRELGAEATALYSCLGVSDPGPDGKLIPFVARSLPFITHWKLLPGDVVVLCSDGLVEEGVFLDPVELAGLLISETDRPASELAELLVQAAKLRHRNPTPWEPEGCGDDVTCIVLVVKPG